MTARAANATQIYFQKRYGDLNFQPPLETYQPPEKSEAVASKANLKNGGWRVQPAARKIPLNPLHSGKIPSTEFSWNKGELVIRTRDHSESINRISQVASSAGSLPESSSGDQLSQGAAVD